MPTRELRIALVNALTADTRVSTVGSGSTTTVVKVGTGEAASWKIADIANLTGSGGSVANNGVVRTVTIVDTTLDKLTVSPALSASPLAGDTVRGGVREWIRYVSSSDTGCIESGYQPSPVATLLSATQPEQRCVIEYDFESDASEVGERMISRPSLTVYGLDGEWLEGCTDRIGKLLHSAPSALTITGHNLWELLADSVSHPFRKGDRIREASVLIHAALSRKAA